MKLFDRRDINLGYRPSICGKLASKSNDVLDVVLGFLSSTYQMLHISTAT